MAEIRGSKDGREDFTRDVGRGSSWQVEGLRLAKPNTGGVPPQVDGGRTGQTRPVQPKQGTCWPTS